MGMVLVVRKKTKNQKRQKRNKEHKKKKTVEWVLTFSNIEPMLAVTKRKRVEEGDSHAMSKKNPKTCRRRGLKRRRRRGDGKFSWQRTDGDGLRRVTGWRRAVRRIDRRVGGGDDGDRATRFAREKRRSPMSIVNQSPPRIRPYLFTSVDRWSPTKFIQYVGRSWKVDYVYQCI